MESDGSGGKRMTERPPLIKCDETLVLKTVYISSRDGDNLRKSRTVIAVDEQARCATIVIPGHESEWQGKEWEGDIHLTVENAAIARVCDAEEHLRSCLTALAEISKRGEG